MSKTLIEAGEELKELLMKNIIATIELNETIKKNNLAGDDLK